MINNQEQLSAGAGEAHSSYCAVRLQDSSPALQQTLKMATQSLGGSAVGMKLFS